MFGLPGNVKVEVDGKTALITFIKDISVVYTEIDKLWVGEPDSFEESTKGNAFYLEDLELGKTYKFRLKVYSREGNSLISDEFEFKTEDIIQPTVAKNIEITIDEIKRNTVTIKFVKGKCKVTKLELYTETDTKPNVISTGENGFYLENLEWGTNYKFKLSSYSNDDVTFVSTEEYSFSIIEKKLPSAPFDIVAECDPEDDSNILITFSPGYGLYTEFREVYGNSSFSGWKKVWSPFIGFNDVYPEKLYKFQLRTVGDEDTYAETDIISFITPKRVEATAPKDVTITIDELVKNRVTISFTKGEGNRTELDLDEKGTWDRYTTDNGFVLENLEFGRAYKFRLRSYFNDKNVAKSKLYSFEIKEPIKATAPSNIDIQLSPKDNTATITFDKGQAVYTEIDCYWINGEGVYDNKTYDDKFVLENLKSDFEYRFKLRSVGEIEGDYAESPEYKFTLEAYRPPTPPSNINVEVEGTTAYIKFTKGHADKTFLDIDCDGNYDDYTTDSGFVINNLNKEEYKFKLVSSNIYDEIAESDIVTFNVLGLGAATPPKDISLIVEGRCVTIKFTKGNGVRTHIDCSWINGLGTWDESTTKAFFFDNLTPGTDYQFRLRTENAEGEFSEVVEYKFRTLSDGGGTGEIVEVDVKIPQHIENEYEEKWFYSPNLNNGPIGVTGDIIDKFEKYGAIYTGNQNSKKVYLTFDEGYEIGNSLRIMDALDANGVKGTFFITNSYLENNLEIVKEMVKRGHSVGNHSKTHPSMANVARLGKEALDEQIITLEENFRAKTGGELIKFFRPPMGKYSEAVLKALHEHNYRTTFWSFAYADFNVEAQKDPNWVFDYLTKCTYNGVIFLLHAVSTTNADILDRFIKHLKASGYEPTDLRDFE